MPQVQRETLGPAERIIQTVLACTDHLVHNRPGYVVVDPTAVVGVRWAPATHKDEEGGKVAYRLDKVGKKTVQVRLGVIGDDSKIRDGARVVGEYRPAGIFPEVAAWMYRQVAEVYRLDNEFAAKWASYAFEQEHRDLKVVLCAHMLVQPRRGDPVIDQGKVAFYDDDYRDVGEAMCLILKKDRDLSPKLLLRVGDLLALPAVAVQNHDLGYGQSAKQPFLGRWPKAVEKWLHYREDNVRLLDGLVKAGFRTTVMELARRVGYRPATPKFFEALRWKQKQAEDGRRTIAIGVEVTKAETWADLSEEAICERVVADKPNLKRIVGLLPSKVGLTRAVLAAAIEAGSVSDKDLVILSPTLEEVGLLQVPDIKARWEKATRSADDMRAANVAKRMKKSANAETLQAAAEAATQKAVEEVSRGIRFYWIVDISGSMETSIEAAKRHIAKMLPSMPPDRFHLIVFNTAAKMSGPLKVQSAAGVEAMFRGIRAGGGTSHTAGIRAAAGRLPDAEEDSVIFFVGDEGERGTFEAEVRASGLRPLAFCLIKVPGENGSIVRDTAAALGIPCAVIDERTFDDVYAIPRTLRNLIASTPVGAARANMRRESLVDVILRTPLLQKPTWAT